MVGLRVFVTNSAEPPCNARAVAFAWHKSSLLPPVADPTTPLCSEVWSRDSDDG